MPPLLKNLLGNGPKDRELADEMHAVLQEMRQERERCQALIQNVHASVERLQQLGEPIARAGSDVDAVAARLGSLEQRVDAIQDLSAQLQGVDERAHGLAQSQQQADAQVASTLEEAQRVRASFEELSQKLDLGLELKDRLTAFLEVEKPFQQLQGDFETLRGQVDGTGEHMARLRDQHDRLMDAHKLAVTKMEALDRRRDELGRELQDKERRVVTVEQ